MIWEFYSLLSKFGDEYWWSKLATLWNICTYIKSLLFWQNISVRFIANSKRIFYLELTKQNSLFNIKSIDTFIISQRVTHCEYQLSTWVLNRKFLLYYPRLFKSVPLCKLLCSHSNQKTVALAPSVAALHKHVAKFQTFRIQVFNLRKSRWQVDRTIGTRQKDLAKYLCDT